MRDESSKGRLCRSIGPAVMMMVTPLLGCGHEYTIEVIAAVDDTCRGSSSLACDQAREHLLFCEPESATGGHETGGDSSWGLWQVACRCAGPCTAQIIVRGSGFDAPEASGEIDCTCIESR